MGRSDSTWSVLAARVFTAVVLFGALWAPAGASALAGHQFKAFGTRGHGSSQLELGAGSGVTVNEATHDIYVADTNNHRVSEFSEAGTFIRAFGADVGGAGVNVCTIGCVEGTAGSSPGAIELPTFIAVDNSGSGDVYVADSANNLISKFEANGTLVASWGVGGQLDGSSATEGPFGEIAGIAVDGSGNLDILRRGEPHRIFEFEADSTFIREFETPRGNAALGLAVDGSGSFFKVNGNGSVEKLGPTGAEVGQLTVAAPATGLASDTATGDLYVDNGGASIDDYAFNGSGEVIQAGVPCAVEPNKGCAATTSFGVGNLTTAAGLAVDASSGTVYAADPGAGNVAAFMPVVLPDSTTEAPTVIGAESAILHGTISAAGGPEADCEFQLTNEEAFNKEGFTGALSVPCEPTGPFSGSGVEAVSAEASGLAPGSNYLFRLVASSANGANPELTSKAGALSFRTLGPRVAFTGVKEVTATAATLTGLIKTNGEATTYHFEYGPTESYGTRVPSPDGAAVLPTGTGNIEFGSKTIKGLAMSQGAFAVGQDISGEGIPAGTTVTSVQGSTLTLSQFPLFEGFGVSLTSTTSAVAQRLTGLAPGSGYHFRIVATGAAIVSGADTSFSTYPREVGTGGRAYEMVSPAKKIGEPFPPESVGALGGSCTFEFCLPGLNEVTMPMQATVNGEVLAFEGQPFSAGLAPSGNQYLSRRSEGGWATSSITPPRASNGREDLQSGFKAFSPDLSRGVLLQAMPALSEEVPSGEAGKAFNDLYLWEKGSANLRPLVMVRPPNRSPAPPGSPLETNAFELAFAGANSGGNGVPAFERLLFEANDALTEAVPTIAPAAPEVGPGACGGFPGGDCNLYEWVGGHLALVNVLPGNGAAASGAVIGSGRRLAEIPGSHTAPATQSANVDHAISADGSRIFWSDESGQVYVRINGTETVKIEDPGKFLTASADGSKVLLSDGCLYNLEEEECEAELSGTPAAFLGILGASEDLSRIYFADTEALAPGAEARLCETPLGGIAGQEEAEGKVPAGFGCNVYSYEEAEGETTFITALNERDNNFGLSNSYGDWKASRSNRTAQVSPDGRYLSFMSSAGLVDEYDNRVVGGGGCSGGVSVPACFEVYEYDLDSGSLECASCNPSGQRPLGSSNLSLIRPTLGASFPQPENLPADGEGRLFFESQDALSPQDTNGHIQDVYEWTPNGVGTCTREKGCIALISSGHSPNDSMFLNATPDAKNAFFVTREQLLAQDQDELLDVYDARVGGGIATGEITPCSGEGCKGPVAPAPQQPSSASSQFSGPGNQKPKPPACKKGFVRKNGKCVKKKQPKKHHHKKKAHHRATSNRGGAK